MSEFIKLRKGLDLNIKGKAEAIVEEGSLSETYAVKPTDFIGYHKPKLLVKAGDKVKAGTPLYFDKSQPEISFCSPVSGEVKEIVRGDKRKLLSIVVLADPTITYEEYPKHNVSDISNMSGDDIKAHMMKSGVWPHLIQRPYAVMADPKDSPKAIFVSGFDTNPLAPDYSVLLAGQGENFKTGIAVLKKLTSGKVHLNLDGNGEVPSIFSAVKDIQINKFSGPHPAGNVGVQIHHLDPINKGEIAWTVNPVGVAQIGKLFLEGKYDASKVVALTGSEVKAPKYYKTISGASLVPFLNNNLKSEDVRVISGSVLSGEKIDKDGHIGFYTNNLSVIPEGNYHRFFGSFVPTADRHSFSRAIGLMSFLDKFKFKNQKEYDVDTNVNGEYRAFVQTGVFEQVVPMDIYPVYLLKAILAEDYDEMEALGIFEVAEEDFALCEYVDVSKHDVQAIVRQGIELMQNS